jgi:hypothetical protein
MVTATRVGAGGGQRNGHCRRRQERLLRGQGWRATRNSIQGNGEGNGDAMVRPTPTTMFDVRGGGGQQPPSLRAPRVTLVVRGRREDKKTARRGATQQLDGVTRRQEGGTVSSASLRNVAYWAAFFVWSQLHPPSFLTHICACSFCLSFPNLQSHQDAHCENLPSLAQAPHKGVLYSAKLLPHPHPGLVKPLNPIFHFVAQTARKESL